VRLHYVVARLLPIPERDGSGSEEGGEVLYKLDELLRFSLGRQQLGSPRDRSIGGIIEHFILSAPEEELLTMIEIMPAAQGGADDEYTSRMPRYGFRNYRNTEKKVEEIRTTMNAFLEAIGSPARFDQTSAFHRDQFEVEDLGPRANLPKLAELEEAVTRLLTADELVSVIVVDLDGFKAVNDSLGHDEGDRCLDAVVDVMGNAVLHRGRLCQFRPGDEFAIVLRNCTTGEAQATAERIRNSIAEISPTGSVVVTASIGVASSEHTELKTTKELLRAADDAMYASKFTTKNCVSSWPVPSDVWAAVSEKRSKAEGR